MEERLEETNVVGKSTKSAPGQTGDTREADGRRRPGEERRTGQRSDGFWERPASKTVGTLSPRRHALNSVGSLAQKISFSSSRPPSSLLPPSFFQLIAQNDTTQYDLRLYTVNQRPWEPSLKNLGVGYPGTSTLHFNGSSMILQFKTRLSFEEVSEVAMDSSQ